MAKRHNFTKTQMREMRERSKDVCEAGMGGTEAFYGMKPGETCQAKAEEFDHVIATAISRTKIKDIDEGRHVCRPHHKHKTPNDVRKHNKAKRLDESGAGIKKEKKPFPQRPKPQPIAHTGTSKSEAAHLAKMAALGKRVPPRRFK